MKKLKLFSAGALALAMFFSSCGGGDEKKETATTDSTSTAPKMDSTAATSDVVTTPQSIVIIWQKVADFSKWKPIYDGHDTARVSHGLHNYVIGRDVNDSNTVLVALKADDMVKAKEFAKDPGLKAAMQKGGVMGAPTIMFSTVVYTDNAINMSDMRSMSNFTVKDWDAWKKSFESHRQTRIDNGLTDRAYGYDADDNHKVTLVVGINDTAKANAFWKSDLLKQQRAEGGVVGEVKRHVYRVVQKY
jgi:hypothetical protein